MIVGLEARDPLPDGPELGLIDDRLAQFFGFLNDVTVFAVVLHNLSFQTIVPIEFHEHHGDGENHCDPSHPRPVAEHNKDGQ